MAGASMLARERHAIIIAPGLWGRRYEVTIEPLIASRPLRTFSSHPEAQTFAEELQRVEGWAIEDRTSPAGS